MKIIECTQGSQEWHLARKGIPTASRFYKILTGGGKLSESCEGLIDELIGERYDRFLPENAEHYTSRAIRWGQECEAEARRWYAMETDLETQIVGFVTTDDSRLGCSPDALVGEDGGLQIKCPQATEQVRCLRDGILPAKHRPQIHGELLVTGRKWWDFLSYAPGLPPLLIRVTPDEYTEKLRVALEEFLVRFEAALDMIKELYR